jgi:hypothetical protein
MGMKKRITRKQGYALAFLMTFFASTLLLAASLQIMIIPITAAYVGTSSRNNALAQQIATIGLNAAQDDIQSKLNLSQTVDNTYRFPVSGVTNVTAPTDPANVGGGNSTIGTYYVTVTSTHPPDYSLIATTTVGSLTYTKAQLLSMTDTPAAAAAPLTCAAMETSIQAGNISTISDSDLKNYATSACYVRSGSTTTLTPASSSSGSQCSSATCTYAGNVSIVIDRVESATVNFNGTFSSVTLGYDRIRNGNTINSTTTVARTFNILNNDLENTFTFDASGSSGAHTFKMSSMGIATGATFTGGSGNDTFSIGTQYISANGGAGNDTFILTGTVSSGKTIDTGAGADTVYAQTIQGTVTANSASSSQIYFSTISGSGAVTGSPGDDIIACNVGFNGVGAACSALSSGTVTAGAGNDIVYLNTNIGASFTVNGTSGNDIIYVGSLTAATDSISSGSGNSLVIVNGNIARSASVTAGGAQSVLLIKTGSTTTGSTLSGFGRTLYY